MLSQSFAVYGMYKKAHPEIFLIYKSTPRDFLPAAVFLSIKKNDTKVFQRNKLKHNTQAVSCKNT